jgi:transcriptional regulator with XRE-family HTH domain
MALPHGSELLKAWMERAKFTTQRQAAQALGLDESFFAALLARRRQPGLANAVGLEQQTGVPASSWVVGTASELDETVSAPSASADNL